MAAVVKMEKDEMEKDEMEKDCMFVQ